MRRAILLLLLATPVHAVEPTTKPAQPTTATKPAQPVTAAKPAHPAAPHTAAPHKPAPRPVTTPTKPSHPPAARPKPAPPHGVVPSPVTPPPVEQTPAEPPKGSSSGLPLPRFAALRSDDVNFRSGPGTRYPIEWVYKRRDLPVEIEREFEIWRLVRDPEGSKGWVHQATLTGRRTAVVIGGERTLLQSASAAALPAAKLKAGVIVRLLACEAGSEWCSAQVGDYRGYIRRDQIWGLLPDEVIK